MPRTIFYYSGVQHDIKGSFCGLSFLTPVVTPILASAFQLQCRFTFFFFQNNQVRHLNIISMLKLIHDSSFVTGSLLTQTTFKRIIMFAKTSLLSSVLIALTAVSSVSAHGTLVRVAGSNGVDGQGFGVVESTPRDGTRRTPFQVRHNRFIYYMVSISRQVIARHLYHS